MSSHDMKNPNGGVSMGHVIEPPDPIIIRLRPDKLCETPGADPHAVVLWGGGERNSPLPDQANSIHSNSFENSSIISFVYQVN